MNKRLSILTIIISMTILLFDILTHIPSTLLGKISCGDRYMTPVDGVMGDVSCGFNTDMHLAATMIATMLLGIILYILSLRKTSNG
jgi:hypothetical protein